MNIDELVPDDAGEYYDGLRTILSKIGDGYGKSIACDKGWYPLIISCDEELTAICPNYEILQIKEKFGTLRYYFYAPEECDCDRAKMNDVVNMYENLSAVTCEVTGGPGVLMGQTNDWFSWVKTLDPKLPGYDDWVILPKREWIRPESNEENNE